MIKTITVQGYKSFPSHRPVNVELDPTKRIALFYGVNGAGKSAIAEVVDRNGNGESPIPECSITVTKEDNYQYLVYNEDFIERTFRARSTMPGIFTIGQADSETLAAVEMEEQELAGRYRRQGEIEDETRRLQSALEQAKQDAYDAVWGAYSENRNGPLSNFMTGYGGSKEKMFQALASVTLDDQEVPPSLEALSSQAQDVGDQTAAPKRELSVPLSGFYEVETHSDWARPIVGSSDSALAPVIQELGNIDWVREGRGYLHHRDDICPFCQQGLPEEFVRELAVLFDSTYERRLREIVDCASEYRRLVEHLSSEFKRAVEEERLAKDDSDLNSAWASLREALFSNLRIMEEKAQNPREAVHPRSSAELVEEFEAAIESVNARIRDYNGRIADRDAELKRIKRDFWRRLRFDYKGALWIFEGVRHRINAQLKELEAEWSQIRQEIWDFNESLRLRRLSITGADRAVSAINGRLEALGIDAFRIGKRGEEGQLYYLDRPGVGEDDYKGLSEGEKTLISFLYFIELVAGSHTPEQSRPVNKKIVVVDDPISSLSHNFVYDVATLVDECLVQLTLDSGSLKQIIVLTHSLFFHHELIKTIGKPRQMDCKRVIKHEHSDVVPMDTDEILNDYESFWQVLRDAKSGLAKSVAVPNAMRSILEQYFYFTRRQESLKGALAAVGSEDHSFRALARYLDRESHRDGINQTDFGDYNLNYYLSKFRRVFEETGDLAHYNAMMGEGVDSEDE